MKVKNFLKLYETTKEVNDWEVTYRRPQEDERVVIATYDMVTEENQRYMEMKVIGFYVIGDTLTIRTGH